MVLPQFLQTIESTALSSWVRDTPSFFGFWFILSVHAIGMAILVGACLLLDLRILGFARDLPLPPLKGLYRPIWIGFWIQLASGMLLLIAYPTKSLTNLDFYLKLVLIAVALVVTQKLKGRVYGDSSMSEADMMARGKTLAVLSLIFWVGVVTSGRLLAYTYDYITYPS